MPRTLILLLTFIAWGGQLMAQRQMETLGRGVVAMHQGEGKVYVGWRLLGTDPENLAFNLYRIAGKGQPVKLNKTPLTKSTNYVDPAAPVAQGLRYFVKPVLNGKEQAASQAFVLTANAPAQPYLSVPLQTLPDHRPNDAAVADLDGDGEYDFVVKQEMTPRDNSHNGLTGTTKLEGYKRDGTMLWRIDLGINIREGAHYTPYIVYDFDGNGRAEIAVRTAEGTIDGLGNKIPDTDGDGKTDYRNMTTGKILEGPEFLSVFDGLTGKEITRSNYIARGNICDWGDCNGNRGDRFLMGLAYLDGKRPSIVMCRGYYALTKLEALNLEKGKLTEVWKFSSADNPGYAGQGNHNLSVADVDQDGKDEIVYGAMTLDDNGKGLYTTRIGHADALHVSDLDPDRPGLEVFDIQERFSDAGANFRDAKTGEVIWKKPSVKAGDDGEGPGRGLSLDVDPRYKGFESWVAGANIGGMFDVKGNKISETTPSVNFGIFWDGDVLSEILNGTTIDKWDYANGKTVNLLQARDFNAASNNGTKSTPAISADILGDWREEVVLRSADNKELRIFTTTIPAQNRFYTFMHDPHYRVSVAWQNVGYNQPPHPGFYFGEGMKQPPKPVIVLTKPAPASKTKSTAKK